MSRKLTLKEQVAALTVAGREYMARAETAEALLAADDRTSSLMEEVKRLTAENAQLRGSLDTESDRSAKELEAKDEEIEALALQLEEFEDAKRDAENATWFAELAARSPSPN